MLPRPSRPFLTWVLPAIVVAVGCTAVLGIDDSYRFVPGAVGGGGGATTAAGSPTTTATGAAGPSPSSSSTGPVLKNNGESCADGSECMSALCVDGVCCSAPCGGVCESCLGADTGEIDGFCAPITALTDPANECTDPQVCSGGACVLCDQRPAPPGGACPPVCSGGCSMANVCTIDCTISTCTPTVTCPQGFACNVACNGNQVCSGAAITCPDTYACTVACIDVQACRNATVMCGTGACEVTCSASSQACTGTTVTCGIEACRATCAGTTMPTLICGASCGCIPC